MRQSRLDPRPCAHPAACLFETLENRRLFSATFYVSPHGNDANAGTAPTDAWKTIQQAMNVATPGSTVLVLAGTYKEKLTVNVSGDAIDGFTTFQAQGHVIINGQGIAGPDMINLNNQSYVQIIGFNIENDLSVSDGSGIRMNGRDSYVNLLNNTIHNIQGVNAMGITVYGTDPTAGISNIVIDGNQIYNCQPANSETISLNGNVYGFEVENNYIHNVNNIGIDCIGGEGMSTNPATDFCRDGQISGNRVTAVHFTGTGRDGAGIFVDGSQNIVVERNTCWNDDVGIEVNAVNAGATASNVIVRDNYVYGNYGAGISLGASQQSDGTVDDCQILNNTLYHDEVKDADNDGELRLQWGSGNTIENNLIDAKRGVILLNGELGATSNTSDYNLFYEPGSATSAQFDWNGFPITGVSTFQGGTGQDANSIFANPLLSNPGGNPKIGRRSPAINAGNPALVAASGETDFYGNTRVLTARVDIGAVEAG